MKRLSLIFILALLVAACSGNSPFYYTTADSGLKGKVAEVELVEMPVVSPDELVLDSLSMAAYHKLKYRYSDNVLREVQVFNNNDEPVSSVTYMYGKDDKGRRRIGTQYNADGTVGSEIFLLSSTDGTTVTQTVSENDTTGVRTTEKWDDQGRLLESQTLFSNGFSYTSQNTYNADGERVSQVVSMLVNEFSTITSSYTYLLYDEHGNWTRALLEKRLESGEVSYVLETRSIRYEKK